MNILHIAHFGITGFSGVGTVVRELCNSQNKLGHNSSIGVLYANPSYNNYTIVETADSLSYFETLLRKEKTDIVIFHSLYYLKYIIYARYCLKNDIPYAIVFHGAGSYVSSLHGKYKKKIANLLLFNNFIRNAAGVIFLSKSESENNILGHLNNNKFIIPNGINTTCTSVKKSAKQKNKIEFMYIGRIEYYYKGLDVLLDAIRIISKTAYRENIHFTFYGPLYNDFFLQDISDLSSLIEYHKPVFDIEKQKAFQNSDVFVLTSRSEGMPMGVLEALSFGLPCIVTPQTNMGDLIQNSNAGWLVELNSEAIAKGIVKAVNDYHAKSEEYIYHAYESVKPYSWDEIGKKSIEVYSSIIK